MTKRSTTTVSTLHPCPRKKKKKPRKDPTHHVVDDDDLPFLDDWFLKSDGNSGNTKTEVRFSPQHDNANSSLNVTVSVPVRTACEKHTNLVHS